MNISIDPAKVYIDNKGCKFPGGIKESGILNKDICRLGTTMFIIMDRREDFDLEKDMKRLGKMDE